MKRARKGKAFNPRKNLIYNFKWESKELSLHEFQEAPKARQKRKQHKPGRSLRSQNKEDEFNLDLKARLQEWLQSKTNYKSYNTLLNFQRHVNHWY